MFIHIYLNINIQQKPSFTPLGKVGYSLHGSNSALISINNHVYSQTISAYNSREKKPRWSSPPKLINNNKGTTIYTT